MTNQIGIVSGTYNRVNSLKRMISSAKKSAQGYGLSITFWLTDGGSIDGTIEWCKTQPDIYLIEHGQLLGAVKAFNDSAYACKADYVILSNDDIEFLDDSILTAYLYMQTHLDCGMGCFYQDRERQEYPFDHPSRWHVQNMPVHYQGRQNWMPYGQVCIVPKWLGDKVGWWGNYLHTYGGDNELTCQIYETGFKVSPIPGTKISDHELDDDLRKINNFGHGKDPQKTGGHHPDSWAWGKHWQFPNRRDEVSGQITTGPTVRISPLWENQIEEKPRIVYLPIYEKGWAIQKEQKRGLREALTRKGLVFELDYVSQGINSLPDLIERVKPTLILTQFHNASGFDITDIYNLKKLYNEPIWVNWNGDYWPENLLSVEGLNLARIFDWQLGVNRDAIEQQKKAGINAAYWQIGYEPDGVGCQGNLDFDLVFLANAYSQARKDLVKGIQKLPYTLLLFGNGWEKANGQSTYDFKAGCRAYNSAKISLGDSQWPETGFVSNRVFQALAAGGSALAHQWFKDMDKLGLIDGKTCIIWHDFPELEKKLAYYLTHEEERKQIAQAGQEMCLREHSFDKRVEELFAMVNPKKEEELSWRW